MFKQLKKLYRLLMSSSLHLPRNVQLFLFFIYIFISCTTRNVRLAGHSFDAGNLLVGHEGRRKDRCGESLVRSLNHFRCFHIYSPNQSSFYAFFAILNVKLLSRMKPPQERRQPFPLLHFLNLTNNLVSCGGLYFWEYY